MGGGSQNRRRGNDVKLRKRRRPCRAVAAGSCTPSLPLPPPPLPFPPPRRSAPGVTRHWAPREPLRDRRRLCPGLGLLSIPLRLQVLFSFRFAAGGVAASLPGSENGGSEAGRERPGFPAGAERRRLQARRGQVHHARVRPGPSPVGSSFCPPVLSFHPFRGSRLPGGVVLLWNVWLRPQPQAAAQLGLSSWVWVPICAPGESLAGTEARLSAFPSPAQEIPASSC